MKLKTPFIPPRQIPRTAAVSAHTFASLKALLHGLVQPTNQNKACWTGCKIMQTWCRPSSSRLSRSQMQQDMDDHRWQGLISNADGLAGKLPGCPKILNDGGPNRLLHPTFVQKVFIKSLTIRWSLRKWKKWWSRKRLQAQNHRSKSWRSSCWISEHQDYVSASNAFSMAVALPAGNAPSSLGCFKAWLRTNAGGALAEWSYHATLLDSATGLV